MNMKTRTARRIGALTLIAATAASCGPRLDHLGREPSFSTLERSPKAVPKNPSLHGQDPATIDDRTYGGQMHPAGIMSRDRPRSASQYHAPRHSYDGGSSGSLWSSDPRSLFGDRRAKEIGDILTVVIDIDDQAQINNETSRERAGDESMSATAVFGLETAVAKLLPGQGLDPGLATTSSSSASGKGGVSRNESISLKVAARVLEVLPNGHLLITGRQEVRVNFELRDLQVMGLIRPEDITRNNDISYDKMAEARISYGGRGHISDMQQARYGQQVLDMISPF